MGCLGGVGTRGRGNETARHGAAEAAAGVRLEGDVRLGKGGMQRVSAERVVRACGVLGYSAFALGAEFVAWGPRVFWTVLLPMLPLGIVLAGFHRWRRVCPIAAFGALGARVASPRAAQRVPRWMRAHGMSVAFVFLVLSLALRLVATNGDAWALGGFLIGLAVLAVAVGATVGGRAFCHYVCPVGVVERIYTDDAPAIIPASTTSTCESCSGCVSACADIDRDKSFQRSALRADRRWVTYAFPGVVLSFYVYYALRAGTFEAYFDGRWTEQAADVEMLVGPGFFFAPNVPAWLAAFATLVIAGTISALLFAALERLLPSRFDARTRRRVALAAASFSAFNLFYLFAGAPTLRLIPGATRAIAFTAAVVATLVVVHRVRRALHVPKRASRRPPLPRVLVAPHATGRRVLRKLPVLSHASLEARS